MAQSGTITQTRTNYRDVKIAITGVTQSSVSPIFQSQGYPIGSFTAQGTFGAAASVQLTGSNDGGTTWFNVLQAALTAAGSGSFVGTNNEIFELYQFSVSGGDGTTNLNFHVFMSATFG